MLVLSRKKDERIIIGDDVRLMVIEIRGDKVRLGIDAPRGVEVHREEVWLAIRRRRDEQAGLEGAAVVECVPGSLGAAP